jgi:hypothetical protein
VSVKTRTQHGHGANETVGQRNPPGHGPGNRAPSQPRELLTDRIVRELPAPARGAKITYDGGDPRRRVSGFGVRVTAAGQRAFILNYCAFR